MPSTEHTHRYAELTWPEVAERVTDDPVCVIPVATLETTATTCRSTRTR